MMTYGLEERGETAMSKIKATFFPQNQINLFLLGVQVSIIFIIFALLLVFIVVAGSEVRRKKIMCIFLLFILTN